MSTTALATTKGKKAALKALAKRREENANAEKIDNGSLHAGSPMYFYCMGCDGVACILPESYISLPKKLCDECQALKDIGWLE